MRATCGCSQTSAVVSRSMSCSWIRKAANICNFVNHCYDLASEVLDRYGIPFSSMLPLIDETARKVHSMSPKSAQTGPAIRYDENVIGMQSRMLAYDDRIRQIYDIMSKSIHERNEK